MYNTLSKYYDHVFPAGVEQLNMMLDLLLNSYTAALIGFLIALLTPDQASYIMNKLAQ